VKRNSKNLYENIFSFLVTLVTVITSIIIILTFLVTYHFITIPMFNTYLPLQIGISISMLLWSIRFYIKKIGREKYIYSIICLIISIASILFITNSVR
jgi:hypothetical protein